jgi:phosphate transport system substrate-binding protein
LRSRARLLTPAAVAALLLACARDAAADETLRASGTGSALGAIRRLASAFAAASPGDRLTVLPSVGSSGAVKAVAQGALDVGLLGRDPGPQEKARLGIAAIPYARTPFVFVVGPRSGVSGIAAEDAARIYRGELTAWPSGERVRLILRPRTDVDTEVVRAISREMAEALDVAFAREGMLMAATNQECDEMAAVTPGAFAPSTLTEIVADGLPLAPLSWNGVAPTVENLASGAYPLEKRLYLAFRSSPRPAVRRFVRFLASPQARKILTEAGNLPLPLPAIE